MIFLAFVPLGVLAIAASIPMLRSQAKVERQSEEGPVDWAGALVLVAAGVVLVLSGSHLHGGEESYVSQDALSYHVPMHLLFLAMLGVFFLVERKMSNPIVDVQHFKRAPFSLSLAANVTYHFSMLSTMTLVPILVEQGFGKPPLYVTVVLLPSQILGLFMPMVAGWVYDRYRPPLMRPIMMVMIAGGFLLLSLVASDISFWILPLLMIPISVGTNMFNPINNATVMNSLPLRHRGAASGNAGNDARDGARSRRDDGGCGAGRRTAHRHIPAVRCRRVELLHSRISAIQPDGGIRALLRSVPRVSAPHAGHIRAARPPRRRLRLLRRLAATS